MTTEKQGFGTVQHPEARDLSRYLVHMTRTPERLAEILLSGRVEARTSFGMGGEYSMVKRTHRTVCLTEMPLAEIHRMAEGERRCGIAFPIDMVRAAGGQPVWYVDEGTAQHAGVEQGMADLSRTGDWKNPLWSLTPFIDSVVSDPRPGKNRRDWRWQREWRLQGDLVFDLKDVAILVDLDGDVRPFFSMKDFEIGAPVYSHGLEEHVWVGGSLPSFGAAAKNLLEEFRTTFTTPEAACLGFDSESGYVWTTEKYETEDALRYLFDSMPLEAHRVFADSLNRESTSWLLADDLHDGQE